MLPGPDAIDPLPGNSWAVRASAREIRGTLEQLAVARRAAVRLEAVTDGACWQGAAFDAFRSLLRRRPLTAAIDHADRCMHEAADRLDWYADRYDDHQDRLQWCRSRLREVVARANADRAAAEAAGTPPPPEPWPEVDRILDHVADIWRRHRAAVDAVAATFDRLDDEPTFATPPPSNLEKVTGVVEGVLGGAWSVAVGLAEGTRDLVVGLVEIAQLLNPVMLPSRIVDLIQNWDEVVAVLRYVRDNPGEFFGDLGKAMLDWDMLLEDPARWVGRRIPDILLTVATGGMGKVGTTAASTARALRGARIADGTVGRLGLGTQGLRGATDAASSISSGPGYLSTAAGFGADASAMTRAGDLGAFHRADTVAGRLAGRFDDLVPHGEVLRQAPGVLNEEIKGFTAVPQRWLKGQMPSGPVRSWLDAPVVSSMIDAKLTGGLTSTLGMADGLLVGAPAMSPELQAAMVGLLGVDALDTLAGVHGLVEDVGAAAEVGS